MGSLGQLISGQEDAHFFVVLSEGMSGVACVLISVAMIRYMKKKRHTSDLLRRVGWSFILFFIFVSLNHFLTIWNIWYPHFYVQSIFRVLGSLLAIFTSGILWSFMSRAVSWPTLDDLQSSNQNLVNLNKKLDTKLQEEALRAKKCVVELAHLSEYYRIATRSAKVAIYEWPDLTKDEVNYSDEFFEILGYARGDFSNSNEATSSLIHKDDVEQARSKMLQSITHRVPYETEYRLKVRDRTYKWFRVTGIIQENTTGRKSLIGAIRDIDAEKKALIDLEDSDKRFELAVEGASVGIWDWKDLSSDDTYWSPKFYKLLGYEPNEIPALVSTFQQILIHPDDTQKAIDAGGELMSEGTPFDINYRLKMKSGDYRWFRATAVLSRNEEGVPDRMVGSIQDIHQNMVLEIKNQRLLEVFDISDDYIAQISPDLATIYLNKRLLEITKENDGPLAKIDQWLSTEQAEKFRNEIFPKLVESGIWKGELGLWDGERDIPCSFLGIKHQDETGNVSHYTGIFRDISYLKNQEERLISYIYGSSDGYWIWNIDKGSLECDDNFFIQMGFEPDEFEPSFENLLGMIYPQDTEDVQKALSAHLEYGDVFDIEFRLRHKDAGYQWYRAKGKSTIGRDGKPTSMSGSISNIHKRKLLEIKLWEALQGYEIATLGSNDGFWRMYTESGMYHWDDKAYKLLKLDSKVDPDDISNSLIHPEDREKLEQSVESCLNFEQDIDVELRFRYSDHGYRWFRLKGKLFENKEEATSFISGSLSDIHNTKKTEEKLRRTNAELEQFAYIASHDLKAPLRGLGNLLTFISDDLDDILPDDFEGRAEVDENIAAMKGQLQRMSDLIAGLLEYARTDRNSKLVEFDIHKLVTDIIRDQLLPDGFMIQNQLDHMVIYSDAFRLSQVFANLISNAIKYHENPQKGNIRISQKDMGAYLEFSVQDDGPGIAPKFHDKIFEMFHTLKPKDELESTGIGLSLVKKIIVSRGGYIQVHSEEGSGATFVFTWPKKEIHQDLAS